MSVALHQPDQYPSPREPQASLGHDAEKPSDQQSPPEEALAGSDGGRKIRGFRWLIICTSLYTTCFLYGLDTTIAADVQSAVITRFGHVDQIAWIGAGFPLGSVCVILFLNTLFNTFNMKWVYFSTVVLFEAGSAICGAAPTMSALIVGRVIAGAGGSGIYLGSLQYLAVMTTEKERGFYMSLIAMFWGLGAVLGPVVGGAFAVSSATWRWAFYINLVIGAVSAPAFLFCLPAIHPMKGVSVRSRLASIDFVGLILGAGVWVSFLLAFTMAGTEWPWKDGRTIATFVVFGVVLLLYVLQQYFAVLTSPARRAFPGHLLGDRTQVLLYIATAAGTTTLYVVVYYIPIYFQFVNSDAALMAAVRLLPFVIIAVAVNLVSGSLLHFIKLYKVIYIIASIFLVAGGGPLMVYLDTTTKTGTIYGLTILVAVGTGLSMVTGYTVATLTTNPEDTGSGLSLQNVSQIGGQVIALAIASQIYQEVAIKNLSTVLAGKSYSQQEIQSAVAGAQSTMFDNLSGELRDKAIVAITDAMKMTFVMVPVAGAIMLIAALCMKNEKLFGRAIAVGG
ncbi:Major facilitator superfamily domain general substrate transporter [Penicillium pulvis]|uniref:Major facilitator superfamily domain general substrate transporter n=1 Tax=Penicillium pulvis TaxID=1562058 RepID=UPI002548F85C|nr:Major facilitator superfamily domain general substrate transporter [Penicillium pulvis]KAJ5813722.1 Major facilitator superfamily domain general substrate transporter [Penicillium pulvis]